MKELILADYHQPSLKEGTYKITAHQDSQELGEAEISRRFTVGGPNLGLSGKEIHSVFPADQAVGNYSLCLPHVVWNRSTLPWEVQVNEDGEQPWLWLLLLSDEEIADIRTGTAAEFSEKAADVFVPVLDVRQPEQNCMYIEVKRETFEELCPALDERKYLCHVRMGMEEENTRRQSKESEKGEFAVIFGSRLPKSGAEKVRNKVYVVSLEGCGADEVMSEEERKTYVRLLVLYSWDFYSIDNGMEPDAIIKGLQYQVPAVHRETKDEELDRILANGYVPVRHELQNGDKTVSFYRGPLTPLPLEEITEEALTARELYRYDPNLGMFDASYACAWQLGRLLTLSRPAIAEKMMKERRKDLQKLHGAALRRGFCQHVGQERDGEDRPSEVLLSVLEKAVSRRQTILEEETPDAGRMKRDEKEKEIEARRQVRKGEENGDMVRQQREEK